MAVVHYLLSLFELLFISVARGGVDGIGISESKQYSETIKSLVWQMHIVISHK